MKRYNFDEQHSMKNTASWKWDNEGRDVNYPLGVADIDFRPPEEVIEAVVSKAQQGNFAYGVQSQEFSNSIVNWYHKRHGAYVEPEWTSYSPGLITALKMLLEAVTHVGDNIIIQSPVYFNFSLIITRNGRNVVENPLILEDNHYRIDFEDLEKKASDPRTTMMVLCNPHNPIAHSWSEQDLRRIADICNKHHVFMVSDEAHSDILFNGQKHIPLFTLSQETAQNSASMNSAGKTFNTNGLYTSYTIIPNSQIHEAFNNAYANHHFDYNMLGGPAQIAAYTYGNQYVDEMLEYLWKNIVYLRDFLQANMPEVKMIKPNATYLMWLDFRAWGMDNKELAEFFKSADVSINSGDIYGSAGKGFVRLNVGCTHQILIEALEAIKKRYDEGLKISVK